MICLPNEPELSRGTVRSDSRLSQALKRISTRSHHLLQVAHVLSNQSWSRVRRCWGRQSPAVSLLRSDRSGYVCKGEAWFSVLQSTRVRMMDIGGDRMHSSTNRKIATLDNQKSLRNLRELNQRSSLLLCL